MTSFLPAAVGSDGQHDRRAERRLVVRAIWLGGDRIVGRWLRHSFLPHSPWLEVGAIERDAFSTLYLDEFALENAPRT